MNAVNPAGDIHTATTLTNRARLDHGLPRWYAILSTLAFLVGVAVVSIGVAAGWFLPFIGVALLIANASSFPLLIASWRANGVIPKDGRLARARYWRVTPLVIVAMFVLWSVALTLAPEPTLWVWLAIVIPFALEHANRLRLWVKR